MGKILRVLILEDSETDAELLLRALRREGYDLVHRRVETGDDLRRALASEPWDVALSDYNMPRLTVAESLSILKGMEIDIPFIVVSGSIGEEMAVSVMKAGAHDFFLKDRVTRLGSAIERELREAQVRRERRGALDDLRQREKQLEAAVRARDEFLAIASHELRTPLTPLVLEVASGLDLVRRRGAPVDPEWLERKLASCRRQIDRLSALIDNMLEVQRLASGPPPIVRARVDLREVVTVALDRVDRAVAASGSSVSVTANEPVIGMWDRDAIETAVRNLLTNAAKFGQSKPIDVRVEPAGPSREAARVSVVDRGIGIAAAAQARIFERFERAVSSRNYGGFGLGLWITRQIVEAHGGTIRVSSAEGQGSTFVVELPRIPAESSERPDATTFVA
jgi:two-component system sensor histidine kinase EvgS